MNLKLSFETEIMSAEFSKHHINGIPGVRPVIHHFTDIDKGDYHDHPFSFTSFVISGSYQESIMYYDNYKKKWVQDFELRGTGDSFYIHAPHIHKIIELPQGQCTTIIIPGKWERHPLFWKFENGHAYNKVCHENTEFKLYQP